MIFEPARVGKTLHVEQVLDRERHRKRYRAIAASICFGCGSCAIRGDIGEGIQHGDPRQRGFGRIECKKLRPLTPALLG